MSTTTLPEVLPDVDEGTETHVRTDLNTEKRNKRQPPYHVVLINDNDHGFPYVVTMLQQLFGHPQEKGIKMAKEVHDHGRVIVKTTTKEHAEFKQDQIHAFGPDKSIPRCQGSMTATIEPAE